MRSERFLHIVVPGRGYSELSTPDAPVQPGHWKASERRGLLKTPQAGDGRAFEEGLGVTVWETQRDSKDWWAVCTYLWKGLDEHKRPFVSNQSCFLPSDKYAAYAASFDSSVLEPLRKDALVPESINEGIIGPLDLQPPSSGHGIQAEELELLSRLTEIRDPRGTSTKSFLSQLLACVLADVGFRMRVKEASDATKLAVVLLKIAVQAGLEKPLRIATFTPKSEASSQYVCQILPDSRLRSTSEFFSNGRPSETAQRQGDILAPAIKTLDVSRLRPAFETIQSSAEVARQVNLPLPGGIQKVEAPNQGAELSKGLPDLTRYLSGEDIKKWLEALQAYETNLNASKNQLTGEEDKLQEREARLRANNDRLHASESTLENQREAFRRQETRLKQEQSQNSFWSAYSKIDNMLQGKQVSTLKENSLEVLHKLLDNPKKDKEKLLDLLADDQLETNIRVIQNVGGNTKLEYGKALEKLRKEKEKRDRKKR